MKRISMADAVFVFGEDSVRDFGVLVEHVDVAHDTLIGFTQVEVLMLAGESHGCGFLKSSTNRMKLYCERCNALAVNLFREH